MSFGGQNNRLTDFVPSYVPRSDYLPNKVVLVNEADKQQILRDIEEDRRRGRVMSNRPSDFNPGRYVSYQVHEQVNVGKPLQPEELQRILGRKI